MFLDIPIMFLRCPICFLWFHITSRHFTIWFTCPYSFRIPSSAGRWLLFDISKVNSTLEVHTSSICDCTMRKNACAIQSNYTFSRPICKVRLCAGRWNPKKSKLWHSCNSQFGSTYTKEMLSYWERIAIVTNRCSHCRSCILVRTLLN